MSVSSSRSVTPTTAGEGKKEILSQRSSKLSQLYCLSRLDDVMLVKGKRQEFVRDLHRFLEENDVDKSIAKLNQKTEERYVLKPLKIQRFRKSLGMGSKVFRGIKRSEHDIIRTKDNAIVYVREENPYSPSIEWVTRKRKLAEDQTQDVSYKRQKRSYEPIHQYQISKLPPKPTPIEKPSSVSKTLNEKLNEVYDTEERIDSRYNEGSIDSLESVYLMMKEIAPSMIPGGIPLAELRYMAQTLPLISLIPRAHKVLTSDMINQALHESRITVVSSRIEELRRSGLWSLRQPKRFVDGWNRENTHRGTLLKEAKWMREDFVEGKKYKIAVCTTLAQAVQDYWTYGKVCCVRCKPIHVPGEDTPNSNDRSDKSVDETLAKTVLVEPLVEPVDVDIVQDSVIENDEKGDDTKNVQANKETEKESQVANEDVDDVMKDVTEQDVDNDIAIDRNDGSDDNDNGNGNDNDNGNDSDNAIDTWLLQRRANPKDEIVPKKLPEISDEEYQRMKQSDKKSKIFKLTITENDLSGFQSTLLSEFPVYKGIDDEDSHINLDTLEMIPVSKSLVLPDFDHYYKIVEKQLIDEEQTLLQLSKRRGLFYGNRRNHYLRPPSVPSLKYLQNRTPTIWLPEDDQELVKNISTYAYNWDLISAQMTRMPSNSYLSNIERRTPWQCFERFVQLNEKFSFSDLKGPRAHAAQQWLIEAHKFQQRQNRRISPLGVGPESIQRGHRRLRWASIFEAMRKTIKKRENAPRPNPTQPRKMLDSKNMKVPTPAEMSALKAQRDEAIRRDIQLRRTAKNRLQVKQNPQVSKSKQSQKQGSPSLSRQQHPVPPNGQRPVNLPVGSQFRVDNMQQQQQQQKQYDARFVQKQAMQGNAGKIVSSAAAPEKVPNTSYTNVVNKQITPAMQAQNEQRIAAENKLINSYVKKIIKQNPGVSPEIALKAAQSYLTTMKNQQAQKRFKESKLNSASGAQVKNIPQPGESVNLSQQGMSVMNRGVPSPVQTDPRQIYAGRASNAPGKPVTTVDTIPETVQTMKSPTPQEILKKFQK